MITNLAFTFTRADIHKELTNYVDEKLAYEICLNQKVLAELYVDNFKNLEITDLETLNLAKEYLAIVEEDLKIKNMQPI